MSFTAGEVAILEAAGAAVEASLLYEFEFATLTFRACDRMVDFIDTAATKWRATGNVIRLGTLKQQDGLSADKLTIRLSLADFIDAAAATLTVAQAVLGDVSEYKGRRCRLYLQFFASGAPVAAPYNIFSGFMSEAEIRRDYAAQAEIAEMTVEGLMTGRNGSFVGLWSDRRHQGRWPGDLGLEFLPQMENKTVSGWLWG